MFLQATVGIDFLTKTIYVDDKMVRMQVWDTAGQEKFHCLIPQYIQDSSVAVVCYDITRKFYFLIDLMTYFVTERKSFEDVGKWISDARNYRGDDIMIVLVGNKLDDEDNREVSTEEGINLAKEKS